MSKLRINIPSDIRDIAKLFKQNGKQLFVVGGAVRDAILGKTPKDFDLATNATPDEVERIAIRGGYKTLPLGKAFGVVVIQTKKSPDGHEIATFRKDIGKGRRPDAVDYTDIQGDVKRRDLTINALFYDLDREEIVDLVGGIEDLKKKRIRTVGKAEERFDEDPLRKLRAIRFAGITGGTIDKDTFRALRNSPSLAGVSAERIRDEFLKGIQKSKSQVLFFNIIRKLDFFGEIFPGLKINTQFVDSSDTIIQLAWLLLGNSNLDKSLNKLKYSSEEVVNIMFLHSLNTFKPENIFIVKKAQERTTLTPKQIVEWAKLIGKVELVKRILKFNLSVTGKELLAQGLKGPEIGQRMRDMEAEKFQQLNESPDSVWIDNGDKKKLLTFRERDAIPFSYFTTNTLQKTNDVVIGIGRPSEMHGSPEQRLDARHILKAKWGDDVANEKLVLVKPKLDGRLWTDHKIISFWNSPSLKMFKKVAEDLKQYAKIDILSPKWIIQLPIKSGARDIPAEQILVSTRKYKGPKSYGDQIRRSHTDSPINKGSRTVTGGSTKSNGIGAYRKQSRLRGLNEWFKF